MLSKLPMLSFKWRVKQESPGNGYAMCGMPPKSVQERQWIDIKASGEEECIVQVELSKSVDTGKVCNVHTPHMLLKR